MTFRLPAVFPFLPLFAALFVLEPPSARARVVVTVDGTPIFERQVERALKKQIDAARLAQLPPEQRQAAIEQAEKAILNELVGRVLLVNAARREGLEVSREALDKRMEEVANRFAPGSTVEEFLGKMDLEREELLRDVEESLLIERLIETKTQDVPPPTEKEVARYYREHPNEFQQAENVVVRHIFLGTRGLTDPLRIDAKRQRAEQLRQELVENPDLKFAEAAKKHSESASASEGGRLGPFGRGQLPLDPKFEEASFSQEVGAISEVLETDSGFHILKVEERNPPRMLQFNEVRNAIATYLSQMKKREAMKDLIEQWRAVATIKRVGG